jgi:hypothetical protein
LINYRCKSLIQNFKKRIHDAVNNIRPIETVKLNNNEIFDTEDIIYNKPKPVVVIRSEEEEDKAKKSVFVSDKQKSVLIINKSKKLRNKKEKVKITRTKEDNKKKKNESTTMKSYSKSSVNLLKICINKDTIKFKNGLEPKIVSESVENLTGIYVVVFLILSMF